MISKEMKMAIEVNIADWELLAQFCQAFRSSSDTFMDQVDMHRAQATLLCRLFAQDGMTQSEIADQLAVQGATITNMLQRMEETGLVTRRRDAEDNRLVRVYLTDAGREKERTINEQFMKLQDAIFEGIGEKERELLRRMLMQMLHNMNVKS
jgi:MarR family transcriptional regulator, organic hydroperoxide resistance regulator